MEFRRASSTTNLDVMEAVFEQTEAKKAMWSRNLFIGLFAFALWFLGLRIIGCNNAAILIGSLVMMLLQNAVYLFEAVGYISYVQGATLLPFCYFFPALISALLTGGYHSPMIHFFWTVYTSAFANAPDSQLSLLPSSIAIFLGHALLLMQFVGYLPELPQFLLENDEAVWVQSFLLILITATAVLRGINLRRLTSLALKKERLSNEAKSRFLATVSHEMRTPLTTILGWMEILSKQDFMPPKLLKKLTIVRKSGEHLLSVINDMLDLSNIETGRLDLESDHFDLPSAIAKTITSTKILIKPDVRFIFRMSLPHVKSVIGDPRRLSQIIYNFMSNAAKFTDEGDITLTVEEGRKRDYGHEYMSEVVFAITDTGIGMTEDVQKRLFKPFTQGESHLSRQFGGTGLGLAISRELIERMHGHVNFRSAPDQGTTFTWNVWFPVPKLSVSTGGPRTTDRQYIPLHRRGKTNDSANRSTSSSSQTKTSTTSSVSSPHVSLKESEAPDKQYHRIDTIGGDILFQSFARKLAASSPPGQSRPKVEDPKSTLEPLREDLTETSTRKSDDVEIVTSETYEKKYPTLRERYTNAMSISSPLAGAQQSSVRSMSASSPGYPHSSSRPFSHAPSASRVEQNVNVVQGEPKPETTAVAETSQTGDGRGEVNQGAQVDPQVVDTGSSEISPSKSFDADSARASVLLAEDNKFNQKIIKKLLQSFQYLVDTADNGEDAYLMTRANRYDVILMDFQMPVLDGIEATKRIRRDHPEVPIIGLTANADELSRKDAFDAGMVRILIKPTTGPDLHQAIDLTLTAFHEQLLQEAATH